MKTSGEGALDVAKNTLDQREMRLSGVMHEETHLLNGIGQIGASQRKILKSIGDTPVLRWISNRRALGGGQLGMSVDGCRG